MSTRAERISQDLQLLAIELQRIGRASIDERRIVLSSIYQLETAAMHWLAEAEK